MSKRVLAFGGIIILALAFLVPLTAGNAQAPAGPLVSNSSRFRVVIAGGMAANADVYVDGAITNVSGLAAALPYNASGYVNATGAQHTITLYETGTLTPMPNVPNYTVTFVANTDYSLVLLSNNSWITITDQNPVPAPGTANTRVINLSATNPTVSVLSDTLAVPEWTNIAYQASSAYVSVAIGNHTLSMTGAKDKVFLFQDAHVYTIFIIYGPDTKGNFAPVILPQTDSNLAGRTLTPTGTLPTPTPAITPTPTIIVGTGLKIYLPMVDR